MYASVTKETILQMGGVVYFPIKTTEDFKNQNSTTHYKTLIPENSGRLKEPHFSQQTSRYLSSLQQQIGAFDKNIKIEC